MFTREIITSHDGSHTLFVPELQEQYHSIHGAWQESHHIFIKNCLQLSHKPSLSILEIGFGTALNAFLTLIDAETNNREVFYHSIELYPLHKDEYSLLNYPQFADARFSPYFTELHECKWEEKVQISTNFSILKSNIDLQAFKAKYTYDVIYFDAFAPDKQPELWTEAILKKMFLAMNIGGILSTYCAKGSVKRNLKAAGFTVTNVAGPLGKREITVAYKL